MAATTIIRRVRDPAPDVELIVGFDVSAEEAGELVHAGDAEPGPEYELPGAVYVRQLIRIRGTVHPAGALLTIGGEITEAEALALLRGTTQILGGEPGATAPGGGIG